MSEEQPVIIEEIAAGGGKRIACASLNSPGTLNSLSVPMIEILQNQLQAWDADDTVACIFLDGAGDKGFCAGGDVVEIYKGIIGERESSYADTCFTTEYRLDYTIHTLNTPIIVWGDGIVMGGGLGIVAAASHGVVTETARLAMPEITIGVFPDVGSTWFLNRMPGRTGLFAGLTGAQMNAGDALFAGLADRFIPAQAKQSVLDHLLAADNWDAPVQVVEHILRQCEQAGGARCPASHLRKHFDRINQITDAETLTGIVAGIRSLESDSDRWLAKCAQTLAAGCPVSAHLVYEQLRRGKHLSLKQCFQRELTMAFACVRNPDFAEGVRARLIDKDGKPDWRYKSVAEVPKNYVAEHFIARWGGEHPLADLPEEPV